MQWTPVDRLARMPQLACGQFAWRWLSSRHLLALSSFGFGRRIIDRVADRRTLHAPVAHWVRFDPDVVEGATEDLMLAHCTATDADDDLPLGALSSACRHLGLSPCWAGAVAS